MLRLAVVDENGQVVTDTKVPEEFYHSETSKTIKLTVDMLPSPGHGLPNYCPGCGWIIQDRGNAL